MPKNKSSLTSEILNSLTIGHRGAYLSVNQAGLNKISQNCTTKIFPPLSEKSVANYIGFELSQDEVDKIIAA